MGKPLRQYGQCCRHRLRELVLSIEHRNWPRSLDRCSEARDHVAFLRDREELSSEEQLRMGTIASDLATVLRKLEQVNRSKAQSRPPDLTANQKRQLHDIIEFVSRIEARMKNLALEVIP